MQQNVNIQDAQRIEAEMPWEDRQPYHSIYHMLTQVTTQHPNHKALTFQLTSGPTDRADSLSYSALLAQVTQMANLFHELGVGRGDAVAILMPNCSETVIAMLAAMSVGIVAPINPMLEAEQISAILRETKAKVVVTLRRFPKTDLAQKTAKAVGFAPDVKTIVQVDLLRYLTPPKSWIVPLIRPKNPNHHHAKILHWEEARRSQPSDRLLFEDGTRDRVAAYFHTGGTTGTPKVAQYWVSGIIYQGWVLARELDDEPGAALCPLPLFHVMAAHTILQTAIQTGSELVLVAPAGYRGDGVLEHFWKLNERYRSTFLVMVPTAAAELMQHPINADVSSVKFAVCGSSPMPQELFHRFQDVTGISIVEGYGMTENTCIVSGNPIDGERKIGSVGIPKAYNEVKVLDIDSDGTVRREAATDEIGEICVSSPGTAPVGTYLEPERNKGLYVLDRFLRTGDLGRIDADGYLWITGRAKDLIIRSGHNIDPAEIEEAMAAHPAVALVAAVGQPDKRAGELPCAFVQLMEGKTATAEELIAFAKHHIHDPAAVPKHIAILDEMPTTMVGKIFKPALRKLAITRIFDAALKEGGVDARVVEVVEDKKVGMVAILTPVPAQDADRVNDALSGFALHWKDAETTA